jgi:hypothetical protein
MPRAKKPIDTATPAAAASKASHLFASRPAGKNAAITRERIAADLEAFRKAGGQIEVLGVTRSLTRIDGGATPASAPAKPRR